MFLWKYLYIYINDTNLISLYDTETVTGSLKDCFYNNKFDAVNYKCVFNAVKGKGTKYII